MPEYDKNPLCFVADSADHGRGLFARNDIPAGTWIGHYDSVKTQPNGEMDGLELYALRDIKANQEITIDYGEAFRRT